LLSRKLPIKQALMSATRAVEVRIGAFLLLALGVAAAFIAVLGHVAWPGGNEVCADFAYLGGLEEGAPVKISGVHVGQVRRVSLLVHSTTPPPAKPVAALGRNSTPLVRACMTLETSVAPLITDGTAFAVASQGMIGEAYIEVEPHAGGLLTSDKPVRGVDAPRLHVMTLQVAALMNAAGDFLKPSDPQQPQAVGKAVISLLGTVNGLLTERRPAILAALDDMAAASADFRQVAAGLKTGVGDGQALKGLVEQTRDAVGVVQREVPPVAARSSQALATLQALGDKANRAMDANALDGIMHDTKAAAQHLEQLSADAERVMKGVRRGEGTLGGFVQDPQLYDDVKELLRDVKQHPWKFLWRD
jgi:phospholipid/cholesterol/gamma-HCH transport system substrate-binding protein